MPLLSDHRILVTGVLTDDSLAFGIARRALEEGATIALSGFGRGALDNAAHRAKKLGDVGEIIELDVTEPAQVDRRRRRTSEPLRSSRRARARDRLRAAQLPRFGDVRRPLRGRRDGACTPRPTPSPPWSARFGRCSHKSEALGGASVVALDFDGTRAYPIYDWMGVMKAALESLGRYLAREVGPEKIRVNMLAAGPIRTMAAKSIPGFAHFEDTWGERAPLGWDVHDSSAVADAAIALLSPLLRGTTAAVLSRRRRRARDGLVVLSA